MDDRLTPCPVCGSENVEVKFAGKSYYNHEFENFDIFVSFWCECNDCGFKGAVVYEGEDRKRPWADALQRWNEDAPVAAKAVEWYRKLKEEEDNTAK